MKDILDAREERWLNTNKLIDKFDLPIIIITLNIPGADKSKEEYLYAHNAIKKDFKGYLNKQGLAVLYFESRLNKDGPETFLVVNKDSKTLKEIGIKFEQSHLLGRIADIDIQDKNKVWSRRDFGLKERKCLICDNSARTCILSGEHSLKEILLSIDEFIFNYKSLGENK